MRPFPFFLLPSSSLPPLFPFLSLPLPLFSLHPFLPLEVGPLNQARGLGERCKLPSGVWAEPQPKSNLVHSSLKI